MRSYRELLSGSLSRENTPFRRGKQDGEKPEAKRCPERSLQGWCRTAGTYLVRAVVLRHTASFGPLSLPKHRGVGLPHAFCPSAEVETVVSRGPS